MERETGNTEVKEDQPEELVEDDDVEEELEVDTLFLFLACSASLISGSS